MPPEPESPSRRKRPSPSRYSFIFVLRVIRLSSGKTCTLSDVASAENGLPLTTLVELEAMISAVTFEFASCAFPIFDKTMTNDKIINRCFIVSPLFPAKKLPHDKLKLLDESDRF